MSIEYIDVEKTKELLGFDPSVKAVSKDYVFVNCDGCGESRKMAFWRAKTSTTCKSCQLKRTYQKKLDESDINYDLHPCFKFVEVDETITSFGYDPRKLPSSSSKKVIHRCSVCSEKLFSPLTNIKRTNFPRCKNCSQAAKHCPEEISELNPDIEKVYSYISLEKTKDKYDIDVRCLSTQSSRLVFASCPKCLTEREVEFRNAVKFTLCQSCAKKNFYESGGEHPMQGKPRSLETRIKIGKASKGRIPTEETREKMSKVLKGRKHSQETKDKISFRLKGKYTGVLGSRYGKVPPKFGKYGSWYKKYTGEEVWMRSGWEIKYADYLTSKGIEWEYEAKTFPVSFASIVQEGETLNGTYTPDFYVNGEWYEVKGYWRDDAKAKFEAFKEQYPDEKITLLMKDDLKALGIDIK